MKTLLVVWIFYQSTFFRVGYSAIDTETFETKTECEAAANIVRQQIEHKHRPDYFSITCKEI